MLTIERNRTKFFASYGILLYRIIPFIRPLRLSSKSHDCNDTANNVLSCSHFDCK